MSDPIVNLGRATPIRETDKALLVAIDDSAGDPTWVPKSCIHEDSECYSMASGDGDLIVQRWWAVKQGLTD